MALAKTLAWFGMIADVAGNQVADATDVLMAK